MRRDCTADDPGTMFSLCSTGLVRPTEGGYANTEFVSEFFAHDGPDSWSHILKDWQFV